MSTALQKAERLSPEIRLGQAISQYESILADAEKSRFRTIRLGRPPEAADVMKLTAEIDAENGRRRRRCVGPRLTNILQAVQQFATVADIIIRTSQSQVAGAIWAVLKTSLLMASNYTAYFDSLSSLFMQIGRDCPRYQDFGILFPAPKVRKALCEYFILVVDLCKEGVLFLQKNVLLQLTLSIVGTFETRFGHFKADLSSAAQALQGEISLAAKREMKLEHQKGSAFRGNMTRLSESAETQRRLKNKRDFLNHCSTYDHELAWKAARKAGSSQWLYQKQEYKQWLQSASGICWCAGILGSGKTVLMANLVEHLIVTEPTPTTAVCFFFCKHSDAMSLNALTILRSLIRQVLSSAPPEIFDAVPCWWIGHVRQERIIGFLNVLMPLHREIQNFYLIIDGLDECRNDELMILSHYVSQIVAMGNFRVFLSSRPDTYQWMSRYLRHQFCVAMEVQGDLEEFIDAELQERLHHGSLCLGDPRLVVEIRDKLINDSQGMFLWANLQLESICAESTDEGILSALRSLPKDLPETFSRILRRLDHGHVTELRKTQRMMFEILAVAQRALTVDELREALSVVPGDLTWDARRLINDIQKSLSQHCGSLVIIDEEDATVQFVHPSVKDYLTTRAESHTIASSEAQLYLGQLCVTYLNFPVHEKQLVKQTPKSRNLRLQDIPAAIISTRHPGYKAANAMAIKLLKGRRGQPHTDVVLPSLGGSDPTVPDTASGVQSSYAFITYATEHWPSHSKKLTAQHASLDLLHRLFNSEVSFVRPPWKDTELISNGWAARHPILWAAAFGHDAAATYLLERTNADLTATDDWGRTALSWASEQGHESLVEMLLATNKVDVERRNQPCWTPLMYAAYGGHASIVVMLQKLGNADPGAKDHKSQSALAIAVESERESVVKLLLNTPGVEVDFRDRHGQTPFAKAVYVGNDNIVRLFLQRTDVNFASRDGNGETPLSLAVRRGHTVIVHLLESKLASMAQEH